MIQTGVFSEFLSLITNNKEQHCPTIKPLLITLLPVKKENVLFLVFVFFTSILKQPTV